MIKINLVSETPAAAAPKKKMPEISLGAKQGDLILLVVLVISALVVGGRWWLLKSELDERKDVERQRQTERNELQKYIDKVEELEKTREALKHKVDVIKDLKSNQRGPVRIMDEVSRALPELVWLQSMSLTGNVLTLRGKAMDENAVANYIANLDDSPFFAEPELKEMSASGEETFSFSLTCVFNYAAQVGDEGVGAEAGA